jgi:hypothetical protein
LSSGGLIRAVVETRTPHDPFAMTIRATPHPDGRTVFGLVESPPDDFKPRKTHSYIFRGLKSGLYSVYATTSTGEVGIRTSLRVEPRSVTSAGVLRLKKGGRLALTTSAAGVRTLDIFIAGMRFYRTCVEKDTIRTIPVPTGLVEIHTQDDGTPRRFSVFVKGGSLTTIRL